MLTTCWGGVFVVACGATTLAQVAPTPTATVSIDAAARDRWLERLAPLAADVRYGVEHREWSFHLESAAADASVADAVGELVAAVQAADRAPVAARVDQLIDGREPERRWRCEVVTVGEVVLEQPSGMIEVSLWSPTAACTLRRVAAQGLARQMTLVDPFSTVLYDPPWIVCAPLPVAAASVEAIRTWSWTETQDGKDVVCTARAPNGTELAIRFAGTDRLPVVAHRVDSSGQHHHRTEFRFGAADAADDSSVWIRRAMTVRLEPRRVVVIDRQFDGVALGTLPEHQIVAVDPRTPVYDCRSGGQRSLGAFAAAELPDFVRRHFRAAGATREPGDGR